MCCKNINETDVSSPSQGSNRKKTRQIIRPGGIFTLLKEYLCANRLIQEHFAVADKRTD